MAGKFKIDKIFEWEIMMKMHLEKKDHKMIIIIKKEEKEKVRQKVNDNKCKKVQRKKDSWNVKLY